MKRAIPLEPVYQCKSCNAILNEVDIIKIKTDELNIRHCPCCGSDKFIKID